MPEKFIKTNNVFKDTTTKQTYVYLNDQKIIFGSTEYQKYNKIYPRKDGHFDINNPHIKQNKFKIHEIVNKFNSIKEKLPEIQIKTNKKTIQNPFTGGYIQKNGKAYKQLLMVYQVSQEDPNKLIPRDQPTHVTYIDKAHNNRLTPRESKKVQELVATNEYEVVGNSIIKTTSKTKPIPLMNGNVTQYNIRRPINEFPINSSNQTEIVDLLRSRLFPNLVDGATTVINAIMFVKGPNHNSFQTLPFLEFDYHNNNDDVVAKIISAIAKFDDKLFQSEDYIGYLSEFSILIYPSNEVGGCWYDDKLRISDPDDPSVTLVSYQVAKNSNNCLLAILKRTSPLFIGKKTQFNTRFYPQIILCK